MLAYVHSRTYAQNTNTDSEPRIDVFNQNGDLVASDWTYFQKTAGVGVRIEVPQNEEYTIVVSEAGNDDVYNYELRTIAISEAKTPQLYGGRDAELSSGDIVQHSVLPGQFNVYRVELADGESISAYLHNQDPERGQSSLAIYDPSGARVRWDSRSFGGSQSAGLRYENSPGEGGGTYTVIVDETGLDELFEYELRVLAPSEANPPTEYPGRDKPLSNGETFDGSLEYGQVAIHRVTAAAGEVIFGGVHNKSVAVSGEPVLELYDPSGQLVANSGGNNQWEAALVEHRATTGGTYTFVVAENGVDESYDYQIRSIIVGRPTPPQEIAGFDAALASGESATGSLQPGQIGWAQVDVPAGRTLQIYMTDLSDRYFASPRMHLYAPDGSLVLEWWSRDHTVVWTDQNGTVAGTYTIVFFDQGIDTAFDFSISANVFGGSAAPTVALGSAAPIGYTEGQSGTPLLGEVTLSDSDSADYRGGEILARSISGRQAGERYAITEGDGITLDGDRVFVDGQRVGTIEASGPLLRIALNPVDPFAAFPITQRHVDRLLEAIAYRTVNQNPAVEKVGQVWLTDGDGNRTTVNRDIVVTPVNNVPVVANMASSLNYFEGTGPQRIAGSFHIADGDYTGGGLFKVDGANFSAGDRLVLMSSDTISTDGDPNDLQNGDKVFYDGTEIATVRVFRLGPSVELRFLLDVPTNRFEVREIGRAIGFEHATANPTFQDRVVRFTFADEAGASDSIGQTIVMRGVDDPPSIVLGNPSGSVTLGDSPQRFFPQADVTDVDSPDLGDGRLIVNMPAGRQSGDTLGLLASNGAALEVGDTIVIGGDVVGTVDSLGSTVRIGLASDASFANVETVLNRLTFANASGTAGVRTVRLTVVDRGNQADSAEFQLDASAATPPLAAAVAGDRDAVDLVAAALLDDDWLD